jgi:hypothetical protein
MSEAVLIAVVYGGRNETLHPSIVVDIYLLRLRGSQEVAHGPSCHGR